MFINGRNSILEAIRAGKVVEKIFFLYGATGDPIKEIKALAKSAKIPTTTLDRGRFLRLERQAKLKTKSQGVIAQMNIVPYVDATNIMALAYEDGESPFIAVLDGLTDPRNIGAVIRSAECAGVHGVLTQKTGAGSITDVVVKASAGAVHHLPLARVDNLKKSVNQLRMGGLQVIGLDERGTDRYYDVDLTVPIAVVIGSEGKGLTKEMRDGCDRLISIPMKGSIASLNASVAASVIFFEAQRQRNKETQN